MATAAAAEETNGGGGAHVPQEGEVEGSQTCHLQHGLPVLTPSPSLTLVVTHSSLHPSCSLNHQCPEGTRRGILVLRGVHGASRSFR